MPGHLQCTLETGSADIAVDQFQREKPGVALVEMMDRDIQTQRGESPGSTDPEDHLLVQAMPGVPFIKTVRDRPVLRGVRFDVRVEQK
jgi:hypothetical protein